MAARQIAGGSREPRISRFAPRALDLVRAVFGSERLGQVVQAFVEHLRACLRTYATCAGCINPG